MELEVQFSGCSCGCTPYFLKKFIGEEANVVKASALFFAEHALYGKDPYRKCRVAGVSLPYASDYANPAEAFQLKVLEEAEKVRLLLHEQTALRKEIEEPFLPVFVVTKEGYALTENQELTNKSEREKFEAEKEKKKERLSQINQELSVYDNISESCEAEEDEDEI